MSLPADPWGREPREGLAWWIVFLVGAAMGFAAGMWFASWTCR